MKKHVKLNKFQIFLIIVSFIATALAVSSLFIEIISIKTGSKYSGFTLEDLKLLSQVTEVKYYSVISFFTYTVCVLTIITAIFTIIYAINGKNVEKFTSIVLSFGNAILSIALVVLVIIFCAYYTKGEQVVYGLGVGIIFVIISNVVTFPLLSIRFLKK